MRKIFINILFLCCFAAYTVAQERLEIVSDMQENVTLHQDSAITDLLLDKVYGAENDMVQIAGYRVQVFSSNRQQSAKNEAYQAKKKIEEADLQVDVYVTNNPPFWKVRVGNFRQRAEAELMVEEIVRRIPSFKGSTYVVPDKISVVARKARQPETNSATDGANEMATEDATIQE